VTGRDSPKPVIGRILPNDGMLHNSWPKCGTDWRAAHDPSSEPVYQARGTLHIGSRKANRVCASSRYRIKRSAFRGPSTIEVYICTQPLMPQDQMRTGSAICPTITRCGPILPDYVGYTVTGYCWLRGTIRLWNKAQYDRSVAHFESRIVCTYRHPVSKLLFSPPTE